MTFGMVVMFSDENDMHSLLYKIFKIPLKFKKKSKSNFKINISIYLKNLIYREHNGKCPFLFNVPDVNVCGSMSFIAATVLATVHLKYLIIFKI